MVIPHRRPRAAPPRLLLALIVAAAIVAACGSTPASPSASAGLPSATSASAGPSPAAPSGSPSDEVSPAPSGAPGESPQPGESETPRPSAGPSPRPGSADACSGTGANRDFYTALAASVAWDVYCPVLPPGWFVATGSYRLSGGGQLTITYRGPGDARLAIREGAICAGRPGCVPAGPEVGIARFGDLDALLLDPGDGSSVVAVASPAGDVGWQATGTGLDGPTLAGYTAAFARVGP